VARAAEEAATYRVRSAQASVTQAADQLRRTAIYAPMSGTVSMLNVELGQRVVGTAQMTGTELMRIAELDQMEIEVDINENDVVNISLGDSARVEVDAYPDRPLRGVVTQIANSARVAGAGTQEQTTNFPVKVQITSAHNQFAEAAPPWRPPPRAPLRACPSSGRA
jgi:HlyD family secretion protein